MINNPPAPKPQNNGAIKIRPKFDLHRIENVILLSMDLAMARELFHLLNEFDDLLEHEYALRERLGNLLNPNRRKE